MGGAGRVVVFEDLSWSIVVKEGKRVCVPSLNRSDPGGGISPTVGDAKTGLIQGAANAAPTQTLIHWEGSNEVDNLGFVVIPSLAERNCFLHWI